MSRRAGRGAVATSHYLATEAGAHALEQGGNAIDAAIAAASTLCVVYPNNVALGGDLVALLRSPEGRTHFINATGPAPLHRSPHQLRDKYGSTLPSRGVETITVPGGVGGWQTLADLGGRLSWRSRLEAAHSFAAHSVPVARSLARALRQQQDLLFSDPGSRSIFLAGGELPGEGDPLVQPELARTFEQLMEGGPEEFYTGDLGASWRAGLQQLGHPITTEDTAEYRPTVEEPLSSSAFGLTLHTGQPNSQGFALLRVLTELEDKIEREPLICAPTDPSQLERLLTGELAELFHQANLVRDAYLADPATMHLSGQDLLSVPAPRIARSVPRATGDTVGLCATSADGWAVSLVQSVYQSFGSGITEPSTGILFQNRGSAFSLDPSHPAFFAPGRRPPHTLMPVMAERGGHLRYVNATMGGEAQPQIHTHLLLRLLHGDSPTEATSAPRWMTELPSAPGERPLLIQEADTSSAVSSSLRLKDFSHKLLPPRDERLGHSNVIEVDSSETCGRHLGYRAASDPRSDGSALLVF